MTKTRRKYTEEFKKNAVNLSYASPKTVKEIAADLDVPENLLYNWRKKFTASGEKTTYATMEEEIRELRRDLAEVKMERDMLIPKGHVKKPPHILPTSTNREI